MRRLILGMTITLDGFIAGPNGETDWRLRSRDDVGKRWIEDGLWQAGLIAMGSRTYYEMAGFWPISDDPLAVPMNNIPKIVFTRQKAMNLGTSRTTAVQGSADRESEPGAEASPPVQSTSAESWAKPEVASGDLAVEMAKLKQQTGKDILALGGVSFAQSLVASGLVDEYRLMMHPIALGGGHHLFAKLSKPLELELGEITAFRSGAAAHVYRPA